MKTRLGIIFGLLLAASLLVSGIALAQGATECGDGHRDDRGGLDAGEERRSPLAGCLGKRRCSGREDTCRDILLHELLL